MHLALVGIRLHLCWFRVSEENIPGRDPSTASSWTPLHQFVYMNASRKSVESLLDLGALRKTQILFPFSPTISCLG
jgi:hypothetical protein